MVCEPESMAGAATIIYLIALKMARRVGHPTHEERALRIRQTPRAATGAGGVGGKDRVERPLADTVTLALEARNSTSRSHTESPWKR
jgi:hypothetical protein